MSSEGEVTRFLLRLKEGDRDVVQPLWERYFVRLVALARARLNGNRLAIADEEDVALSAFNSFCRRAEAGCFPRLNDRNDLWQILVMIAERKVCDLIQHENRLRRDHGRQVSLDVAIAEKALGGEPDPATAAQMADQFERLMSLLPDGEFRTIALRKLEGYTNEEIARQMPCSLATIERRLKLIRTCWKEERTPSLEA